MHELFVTLRLCGENRKSDLPMRRCWLLAVLVAVSPLSAQQSIPLDPAVIGGRLSNGLRYYILENRQPAHRAELRLVVNAGSVLEDPDQLGLAHFVEHMAFNGTANFPKQNLVQFIEKVGMTFGADLNAGTSFDETRYQLTLPTDSAGLLEKGIQVLEDWSHAVSFDTTEIRKERGVVIEEWRLGQGASGRIRDRIFPVLLRGSRYGQRLPIGNRESLEHFDPEALVRFYRDWYRPDLIAVVAVGDFDGKTVERMIRKHFGSTPKPRKARVRPQTPRIERTAPEAVIVTDPEATRTTVQLYFLRPEVKGGDLDDFRKSLVASLYSTMLNQRLAELAQQANPPFLGASGGAGQVVRGTESFTLSAAVTDSGVMQGFEALLAEVGRVEQHGFVPAELARARQQIVRAYENAVAEREHLESADLAESLSDLFLTGEPFPGIVKEQEIARKLLDQITLEEVNGAAHAYLERRDRVVTLTAPERSKGVLPTTEQLLAAVETAKQAKLAAYVETLSQDPLVTADLSEAAIVSEQFDSAYGVTHWTLANGVRVILKPTDFKADEVLLTGYSPGGLSRVPDSLLTASAFVGAAVRSGGLGAFSAVDLRKKLAGNRVGIGPYIGSYEEGLNGAASPAELPVLFQLAYLLFTAPRVDSTAFEAVRTNVRTQLKDRGADPGAAFSDTLSATLMQHHRWSRPLTVARADSVTVGPVYTVYRDRFADASDFTFVLVGNFKVDSLRPLVRRYLGSLPVRKREDSPRDLGITTPPGVVDRIVRQGIAPQSRTALVYSGSMEWKPAERWVLKGIAEILEVRLREKLREDLSGTYSVSVSSDRIRIPRPEYRINIRYGSAPDRAADLATAVTETVDSLRRIGPTESELANWKANELRRHEVALRENDYWLSLLASVDAQGEQISTLLEIKPWLDQMTTEKLRAGAEHYLNPDRYVRVTLLPAETAAP